MATTVPASEPNPELVWETMNAHQRTAALRAAIDLDVFTAIAEGAARAGEIAQKCQASPRGIRILCDYLTIIGFLTKTADAYGLTPTSAAFLNRHSPGSMSSIVHFLNSAPLMNGFARLTEAVRKGDTQMSPMGTIEPEFAEWVTFAESMIPVVKAPAEFIAEQAAIADKLPRRVLDIAAGHGMFGITLAQRVPQAEISAVDWPNVLAVARKNAHAAGLAERYRELPGDAFEVEFGDGYDIVLMTNFLHHFNQADCLRLLKKVHSAMTPGGRLMTLEFVPNDDRITPPIPASFSLMMLGTTPEGDAYTMREFDEMLREAGFSNNQLLPVPRAIQSLIVSTK